MSNKIRIVWNTVRYMTLRQWKYRLYYMARNKLGQRKMKSCEYNKAPFLIPMYYGQSVQREKIVETANRICQNEFNTVSGIVKKFETDIDWDLKEEDYRLVCFKLNSFRWLLDLSDAYHCTDEWRYIEKGFSLIRDWQMKNSSSISGDKWNAYVIAERITNWICFCSQYCAVEMIKEFIPMIYMHALELKNSLEYQLGANHLLSEGKALVFAGAFLRDKALYELGKKLLITEAKEQFLKDGGHYERSISYHVESLQQYFEVYAVLKICNDEDADKFADLMREPYRFLNGMIGVNGKIPLFNDAAYDYPFYDAVDFLGTASFVYFPFPPKGNKGIYCKRWEWLGNGTKNISWDTKSLYNDTGYVHYQFEASENKYSFFMDVADCGPDSNLGHAHADTLSVLLCSEKKEILADSGVFSYKLGCERDMCRSTKAHNTVEINGMNSAEVWSAFRVARRGHAQVQRFSDAGGLCIEASHDGYVKCLKSPVEHIREVNINHGNIEIIDILKGKRAHKAVSRLIVGPRCRVTQIDTKTCLLDDRIIICAENEIRIVDCDVAGMFGVIEKTKCIEIDFKEKYTLKIVLRFTKEKGEIKV